MTAKKIFKIFVSFAFTFLIAFLGSLATTPAIDNWYKDLTKPFFNPPNWIFSPVWTILFIFMAYAFYLIWTSKDFKKFHLKLYFNQLIFNFLWSFMFFFLKNPTWAFIVILILIVFITLMAYHFFKVNKLAGYLILPYLIWISFASILNLTIIILN